MGIPIQRHMHSLTSLTYNTRQGQHTDNAYMHIQYYSHTQTDHYRQTDRYRHTDRYRQTDHYRHTDL